MKPATEGKEVPYETEVNTVVVQTFHLIQDQFIRR